MNKSKQDKLPMAWLIEKFPEAAARQHYCNVHDLGTVPDDIVDFDVFYEARRDRLARRLRQLLKLAHAGTSDDDDPVDGGNDG